MDKCRLVGNQHFFPLFHSFYPTKVPLLPCKEIKLYFVRRFTHSSTLFQLCRSSQCSYPRISKTSVTSNSPKYSFQPKFKRFQEGFIAGNEHIFRPFQLTLEIE